MTEWGEGRFIGCGGGDGIGPTDTGFSRDHAGGVAHRLERATGVAAVQDQDAGGSAGLKDFLTQGLERH